MSRVDLPGDQWADLADPLQVTHKKRKPVRRVMFELVQVRVSKTGPALDAVELDLLEQLSDLMVVALVDAWSFPVPVDMDGLGELPGDAYDALQLACAPLGEALLPSFEVDPDPKGPPTSGRSPVSVTDSNRVLST